MDNKFGKGLSSNSLAFELQDNKEWIELLDQLNPQKKMLFWRS